MPNSKTDITLKIKKNLTLSDLAKLAGVSTSTVSRALNENPIIKKETRTRIKALAEEYNFSLNAAASRLRTQKTNVIAVILNLIDHTDQSTNDPFLLKVVGDLNQALNNKGYELLLSNSFMATGNWANYFISSSRADGLIVIGQGISDEKVKAVAAAGSPMVVWGDPKSNTDYPIVGSDNRLGGYLATKHLLDGGCKKIIYLGNTEHAEMGERHKGYCQALEEKGLKFDANLTLSIDLTSKAAHQEITNTILHQGLYFDGIVAASDMVALGALKALKERYINVPNDVGIVGFDDISMAELFHPSLTTIRQNTKKAAEMMVEKLVAQLHGEATQSSVIDIELIPRNSTHH
ncbi:MAG: DNA-binding LacI/PurR family transcriptional regulator [Paraglaciecola sp.]|jgi:DNA-binding LacI/PurR family transcriptional regulator